MHVHSLESAHAYKSYKIAQRNFEIGSKLKNWRTISKSVANLNCAWVRVRVTNCAEHAYGVTPFNGVSPQVQCICIILVSLRILLNFISCFSPCN